MQRRRITLPAGTSCPGSPCRILIDAFGIAHLYAADEADLFFVQGFNAARDRLWQIDLWYKRGRGRLAQNFGKAFLAHDIAARKVLFRGDLEQEWAAYGADARTIFRRFVDGVNSFIALTRSGDQPLPAEFRYTGTQPDIWSADEAIAIRFHGLMQNVEEEVARARLRADDDHAGERFLGPLQPPLDDRTTFTRDEADLLEAALAVYRLAVGPLAFGGMAAARDSGPGGSNAWAISGSRTPSGKPILASDPHRALATPSLRYIVGLHAPGLDLVGGGEPMQPGVSIGHNGQAAFGLTIFPADQEDFVIVDLTSDVPVKRCMEAIHVRGQKDPVMVELDVTPVGPVLARNDGGTRAIALQSVWFEPGAFPYLQSLRYRKASSPAEFSEAARHWGCPAVNLIYADRQGDIARWSTGFMPKRRQNGLVPRHFPGEAQWQGVYSVSESTRIINPAGGYVQTANEFNLPANLAKEAMLGFEWTEGTRSRRIASCLNGGKIVTTADALALQLDKTSLIAHRIMAVAGAVTGNDERVRNALSRLAVWDAVLGARSREAAVFEIWHSKHLKPALVALATGKALSLPHISNEAACEFLETLPAVRAQHIIETSLAAALDEVADHDRRLDREALWGDIHHAVFPHGLSHAEKRFPIIGPFPQGGSESTVFHSGYDAGSFVKLTGSTFRIVVDLADLDRSFCINAPGQSGDITSPFYEAMAGLWAEGRVVPMVNSFEAVTARAQLEIEIVPPRHEQSDRA